jgi:hypothetical protein
VHVARASEQPAEQVWPESPSTLQSPVVAARSNRQALQAEAGLLLLLLL